MRFVKWISTARLVFIGLAALPTVSTAALADPTALVCDVRADAGTCCVVDGPGTIVVDEAGGSVTVHYPPEHTIATGERLQSPEQTFAARFSPETITYEAYGRTVTINRLTGAMYDSGVTWTCHVGKAQF